MSLTGEPEYQPPEKIDPQHCVTRTAQMLELATHDAVVNDRHEVLVSLAEQWIAFGQFLMSHADSGIEVGHVGAEQEIEVEEETDTEMGFGFYG